MNRRTLFKGLAALPLLKYLDLGFSTEPQIDYNHWSSWNPDEVEQEPHREPCLSNAAYERLMASGGMCAPMAPTYTLAAGHRPVRDALPVFTAPRGRIRYFKPE